MPISQTNQLFTLIKSLTPSEKRHFRVHVNRSADAQTALYIQLFDILDKQKQLDETVVFKKIKGLNKSQFSNLKRHLYAQIMTTLEQVHKPKRVDLQIRELLNYAHILYGKGLFLQSLKLLQKAKLKAARSHYDLHYMSILEFEKKIESRHITRSGADTSIELAELSSIKNKQMYNAVALSNLRIFMHNRYIKFGHVRSAQQEEGVALEFTSRMPKGLVEEELGVKERAYLYQSFVWYHFILLDFEACYTYALKWVQLFKNQAHMTERDPDVLMRGYHYVLTCAYNTGDLKSYEKYLAEVELFRKSNYKSFNNNSQIMSFIYVHHGRLNRYFLNGAFDKGLAQIPKTLSRISRYGKKIDAHRIMVFYYKIAWMHMGAGQPEGAVEYLQKIINMNLQNLVTDLQIYTRLMFLMAHYELENEDLLGSLVKQTNTFITKLGSANELQTLCLQFFKKVITVGPFDRKDLFQDFQKELIILQGNKYERRTFLYLDIPSWVASKLRRVALSEVIRGKYL